MSQLRKVSLFALTGAAALISSGSTAHAALTQQFKFFNASTADTVSIDMGARNVYVGRYFGSLNGITKNLFCIDFDHSISTNTTYDTLTSLGNVTAASQTLRTVSGENGNYYYQTTAGVGGGAVAALNNSNDYTTNGSLSNSNRASEVAWLTDTYLNSGTASKSQLAGVQLAIWDIVHDGGDGLSNGDVKAFSNSQSSQAAKDALTYAGTYLTTASSHSSYTSVVSYWIQADRNSAADCSNHDQDFVYTNAIPEPAFYQLSALLTLGSISLLRRRRK